MRVPDLLLRSIGFVSEVFGEDISFNSLDPIGTAFLVNVPGRNPDVRFCYAITAKHVVEKGTPNAGMVIVVNRRGSGVALLQVGGVFYHPDPLVDVIAMPIKFDASLDVSMFDADDLFDETNNPENIGPGDEVFFPGLFWPAPGSERVIPLVRHGNLAMLPGQEIQTNNGYEEVYLIEARSIGGVSGSPVFVRETVALPVAKQDSERMMQGLGRMKLLGLVKGHWDVDESRINQARITHDPKGVNLGIAQVVPAKRILEILNLPELVEMRHKLEDEHLSSRGGTND